MAPLHPYPTNKTISNAAITSEMLIKLQQLTIEEKVTLLGGRDFRHTGEVPRLGLPSLKLINSTSAAQSTAFGDIVPAACFPNVSALAATWNRPLMQEMGKAMAGQTKYKGAQVLLGPTINIHRDPRGGRNFESFSEDPVLTGHLAAAYVNGLQSEGVGACLKHFVCNECETLRAKYSSNIDMRVLREIYMSPFQWIIREARPLSIMTSYNQVNNVYTSQSSLLQDVVRQEWGFDGLFISDWFGTYSRIPVLKAGLDLEMPGPTKFRGKALVEDVKSGKVNMDLLDARVLEVMKWITRTSEVHSNAPEEVGEEAATSALTRKVAAESMVLLKNEGNLLPLPFDRGPKLAVIGKLANEYSGGGGSASGVPQYVQRPYDSIQSLHPEPEHVTLSKGVTLHRLIPSLSPEITKAKNGKQGIDVIYRNDNSEEVILSEYQPAATVWVLGRIKPGLKETGFTYEMTTSITPKSKGNHTFAVVASGSFELLVDGKMVMSNDEPDLTVEHFLFMPWLYETRCSVPMEKGRSYSIKLIAKSRRHSEAPEPTPHCTKLGFLEEFFDDAAIEQASQAASKADVSVVFVGRNAEWESEGSDQDDMFLPGCQEELVKSVAKASKKTVVVLYGGNPFDVSGWINDVDAVIFAQYPGQEGGAALADILAGATNPSGKLPMSWPKNIECVPTFKNFPAVSDPKGVNLNYEEGMKVGYRYYDTPEGQGSAMWQFGYGLSYTHFEISDLKVRRNGTVGDDQVIEVDVIIENTGPVAGAEVLQVYFEDVEASIWRPARELKGFEKVFLKSKEKRTVTIRVLEKYALSFWDERSEKWLAEVGEFKVHVGNMSALFMLEKSFSWLGV